MRANAVLGNRQRCYDYHLRVTLVVTLFETILKTIAITAMTPERPLHTPLCEIRFARFAVGRISSSPPLVNNTNPDDKLEFVLFFSNEYFGIKVDLNGKKKKLPGV